MQPGCGLAVRIRFRDRRFSLRAASRQNVARNHDSRVYCATVAVAVAAFADIAAAGHGSTDGARATALPALPAVAEDDTGAGTELTVRTPADISLAS